MSWVKESFHPWICCGLLMLVGKTHGQPNPDTTFMLDFGSPACHLSEVTKNKTMASVFEEDFGRGGFVLKSGDSTWAASSFLIHTFGPISPQIHPAK